MMAEDLRSIKRRRRASRVLQRDDNGHAEDPVPDRAREEPAEGAAPEVIPVTYRSTRLADVEPQRVRWLWPARLPVGKLVLLDGDPDVGKSTLALDLVARLTTGSPMPGQDAAVAPPSDVVLLAAEDGLGDTIRPRLDAAGADVTRVHHFDSVPVVDGDGTVTGWVPPTIPEDLTALENLIVATGAKLVVVDVLMAYLSGRADSHRDQDVRRALSQLGDIAERTGACVILLRHLRKSRGSAMYAGGGSIGIIGVARAGMVAAVDPNDPARRILARAKGNLAPPYPSMAYRLVADGEEDAVARVEWLGEVETTGDQLLAPAESGEERSALADALDWLRDVLGDEGPTPRSDILRMASAAGHTRPTVERAQAEQGSGVVSERDSRRQGRPAVWRLAEPDSFPSAPLEGKPLRGKTQAPDQGKHVHSEGLPSTLGFEGKPPNEPPACQVCGEECRPDVSVHPFCEETDHG